jgi:hypothetical protein
VAVRLRRGRPAHAPGLLGTGLSGPTGKALREYRPLLDRIRSAGKFTDPLWEVFGDLGIAHAYAITAENSRGRDPRGELGKLGADLSQEAGGGGRVDRVLPGESSDPLPRPPLPPRSVRNLPA